MADDERVAQIRARVDAATPGPWYSPERPSPYIRTEATQWVAQCWNQNGLNFDNAEDNAEFIAHSRADVPWLLAALDHAREDVRWLLAEVDTWRQRAESAADMLAGMNEAEIADAAALDHARAQGAAERARLDELERFETETFAGATELERNEARGRYAARMFVRLAAQREAAHQPTDEEAR